MSLPTPEEFKDKFNVSIGAMVYIFFTGISLGVLGATLLGAKDDIVKNHAASLNYTEQEVGGLRSDWDRGEDIRDDERNAIYKRIEDLEKYHKE
jgi:hypothetical protein